MMIHRALARILVAVVPVMLAGLAPGFASSAAAATAGSATTATASAAGKAVGPHPSIGGTDGGTTGLCPDYPLLSPFIVNLPSAWWGFSSDDFTAVNGIRTCGFIGTPDITYSCTGGEGYLTDVETVGGYPGGPQDRRSFTVACDGAVHTISADAAWGGFTITPFHVHWHTDGADYDNGYLSLH